MRAENDRAVALLQRIVNIVPVRQLNVVPEVALVNFVKSEKVDQVLGEIDKDRPGIFFEYPSFLSR